MTVQIEIKEETAAKLQAVAASLELSLEEYLERIAALFPVLPANGAAQVQEGPVPYELVENLIGVFDSTTPYERPKREKDAFGRGVTAKLEKQGLKLP